jgi:hypothetical protein
MIFIRALMQVVRYYQYLKDDRAGTGLGKEELQLRAAQRTAEQIGDPKVLNVAMARLPGAELFCTRELHLAGEEVFGSQKRKADVPLVLKASHTNRTSSVYGLRSGSAELTMLVAVYQT